MGTLSFLPEFLFWKCHLIPVMWLPMNVIGKVLSWYVTKFRLFVHRRLNVRVNIELLSVSNPVHKKVCGLVIFMSFIRFIIIYLNFIV